MNKLMEVSDYRKERFIGNKVPSVKTLQRLINSQHLPGKKIGRSYYVDVSAERDSTGDPILDAILKKHE